MLQQSRPPEIPQQDNLFCMLAVFVYVAQLFYLPLHLAQADHLEGSHHAAPVAIHQEHHAVGSAHHHAPHPAAHEAVALQQEEHDHHDHKPHSVLDHSCDQYFKSNRSALDFSHDVAALAGTGNSLVLPPSASLVYANIRLRPPQSRPPGSAWSRGPPAIA